MISSRLLIVLMVIVAAPLSWLVADSVVEDQQQKVGTDAEPVATSQEAKEASAAEAQVSEEAQGLIEKVAAAYEKLQSAELAGRITLATDDGSQQRSHEAEFTSAYQAPNRFKHQVKEQALLGSTGEKAYGYSPADNVYFQEEAAKEKVMLSALPQQQSMLLRAQNPSLVLALSKDPAAELKEDADQIKVGEAQQIDGTSHPALTFSKDGTERMTMLIDPQTHLIRRVTSDLRPVLEAQGRAGMKAAQYTVDYTAVKPDAPVTAEQFAWAAPAGARDLAKMAAANAAAAGGAQGEEAPLVGKEAPDFTLENMEGKPVTLSDLKGSVVVLDFWATWCGPCVMALPHLDKVHEDLKEEGLKVFAVNLREGPDKVKNFMQTKKLSLPVLYDTQGEVAKQYGVRGIPTQVIIGKDGTVKKFIVGYNPKGDQELRDLLKKEMAAK